MSRLLAIAVVLLAGCDGSVIAPRPIFETGFRGETGFFGETFFCVTMDPESVELTGGPDVESREAATVTVRAATDCIDVMGNVEEIRLDDPKGAFELGSWEAGPVFEDSPKAVQVRLIATEPGTYEGQLIVAGSTVGPTQLRATQLFGVVTAD